MTKENYFIYSKMKNFKKMCFFYEMKFFYFPPKYALTDLIFYVEL